jgi:hypothetical protein
MYVSAKMIPVETVPGIRGGDIKQSCGEGEFKYDIFDTLSEPLLMPQCTPTKHNYKRKKKERD